jgi:hypothetical protein
MRPGDVEIVAIETLLVESPINPYDVSPPFPKKPCTIVVI